MEIITKEEVLKLYDNQELSDDEIEDVYGGVSELQKCIGDEKEKCRYKCRYKCRHK